MDFVNKILNFTLPPVIFLSLVVFWPILFFFKLLRCVLRYRNAENVAGKVIVITGASSGIGEHLAYEYARRGARLTLFARREDRLHVVADMSRRLGSPDVIVTRGDVSVVEDCKRLIEETINHYGQLDHLVNNAGIAEIKTFADYSHIADVNHVMNTNFWGPLYTTHFAIPHLKRSRGKIVAVASAAAWFSPSKMSIYGATKAAMLNFYETLRLELGPEIGITIVTPGLIKTEMLTPERAAEAQWEFVPGQSAGTCATAIVDAVCHGERTLAEPSWVSVVFWLKAFCPEFLDWTNHINTKRRKKNE